MEAEIHCLLQLCRRSARSAHSVHFLHRELMPAAVSVYAIGNNISSSKVQYATLPTSYSFDFSLLTVGAAQINAFMVQDISGTTRQALPKCIPSVVFTGVIG